MKVPQVSETTHNITIVDGAAISCFRMNHLVTYSPFLGSILQVLAMISSSQFSLIAHPEINIKPPPQWVWNLLFPPELTATPLTPRTAEGPACTQYCPQRPSTVQEAPRAQLPWQYRMAVENPPCSIADTYVDGMCVCVYLYIYTIYVQCLHAAIDVVKKKYAVHNWMCIPASKSNNFRICPRITGG